jgi:hypothetical protein
MVPHAGGAAEVFLEGKATRHALLSREHRGSRAVLNALERVADGYRGQLNTASQDLAIAQGQLRDHQARLGRPFPRDGHLSELTDLRDQLKAGLLQATQEPGTPAVAELAERIKSLKAAHTIDATPERTVRRLAAEEPVTARIRRRTEEMPAMEPPAEAASSPATAPVTEAAAPIQHEEPPAATIHPFPKAEPAAPRSAAIRLSPACQPCKAAGRPPAQFVLRTPLHGTEIIQVIISLTDIKEEYPCQGREKQQKQSRSPR